MISRAQRLEAAKVCKLVAEHFPECGEAMNNAATIIYEYGIIPYFQRKHYYTNPETGQREYHEMEEA